MRRTSTTSPSASRYATSSANFMPSVCTDLVRGRTNAPSYERCPSRPRRRVRRVDATSADARTRSSSPKSHMASDVEAELEHVAVDDLVVLPLDAQLADVASLRPRPELEQLVPVH